MRWVEKSWRGRTRIPMAGYSEAEPDWLTLAALSLTVLLREKHTSDPASKGQPWLNPNLSRSPMLSRTLQKKI